MAALRWVPPPLLLLGMLGAIQSPLPAQEKEEKPVGFTGDFVMVSTAGNTHVTTVNLGDKVTVKAGRVLLAQTLGVIYGKSAGEVAANSRFARLRADYQLAGSALAGYGFAGYERNKFAGIAHRTEEGVGLALKAWHGERDRLDLEAGVGLVQETRYAAPGTTATVTDAFASGRLAAAYKHGFTKAAYFQQTLEFPPNLKTTDDYRLNGESALVAPLSSHIALKMGYTLRFENLPASPELAKTDRIFVTGLQVTF